MRPDWVDISTAWSNTLSAIGDLTTTEDLEVTDYGRETFDRFLAMQMIGGME